MNQAADLFNRYADSYASKFMNVDRYDKALSQFVGYFTSEKYCLLDLACGPGNISSYLFRKNPLLRITGIDLAPAMVELAKKHNPSGTFFVHDARKCAELDGKFDGIVNSFLLPYLPLSETSKLIEDSVGLLNPYGKYYLCAIDGKYSDSSPVNSSTGESLMMHYYDEVYLSKELQKNRMTILFKEKITYIYNDKLTTDIVIIAQK